MEKKNLTKYEEALSKYNTKLSDAEVTNKVKEILSKNSQKNDTKEVKKLLFNCIDLTSLKTTDSQESILKFTEKVNEFDEKYAEYGHVASICVYPNFAKIVSSSLEIEGVNITCVSAGFPSSQTFTEVKIAETSMALLDGATEIDIVINVGSFLSGDYESLCEEVQELKEVCKNHHMKVILETGALKTAENIKKAAILAMYSGADFIKTSTGKLNPAATVEAAYVMCTAIKEYYLETGRKIGFKPAGGLATVNDAVEYYTIVKEVLGQEWLNSNLFRLGTSSLANLILSDLEGKEIKFF